jgi:hypothetical protein
VRIKALALAAALAAGFAATSASAAPVSGSIGVSKSSDGIVLVDHKKGHKNYFKHGRHYKPGSHHKHAPKNWRRYDKRPGDWRTRGCVIVGPIWWCP